MVLPLLTRLVLYYEDTGQIYPQLEDGNPDWDCPISLYDDEVSSEWIESLSSDDYNVCKPYLNL